MTKFRYSKTSFMPDGQRTIEVEIDDVSGIEGTRRAITVIRDSELEEAKIATFMEKEAKETLLKDPLLRIEMLRAEKLRLESELMGVSGLILREEEKLAEKGG